MLVTVPLGIILCGTVDGLAAALASGLRGRALKLLKVPGLEIGTKASRHTRVNGVLRWLGMISDN